MYTDVYTGEMSILNVRLGAEEQRLADELRDDGVAISRVVRDAIRAEHARRVGTKAHAPKPSSVVEALLKANPAPSRRRAARPDPRDRHAVREHIADKLRAARRPTK